MKRRDIEVLAPTTEVSHNRPRLPDPEGPPRLGTDHPKAGFYRVPPCCAASAHDLPAAANAGRYL
jgi:hypothetical protein